MVIFSFLCNNGTNVYSNKNISTTAAFYCYSTQKYNKGTWYAEITHYTGTNAHLIGISNKNGNFLFYPEKNITDPVIYASGCFTSSGNDTDRTPLPITLEPFHIVGVSINFDNQSFSVFYQNSFYTYNYKNYNSNTDNNYHLILGGGNLSLSSDLISINVGEKPFYYNIPSLSFYSSLFNNKVSCADRIYTINLALLTFIFIM